MDYDRSHVVAEADAFDADEMTFVSPLPRPGSPLWAIVRPLEPYVWAAVSATFLVGVVAFVKIGRAEEKAKVVNVGLSFIRSIDHRSKSQVIKLKSWSSVGSASWYCFGTLLCQSVSSYGESKSAPALRVFIAAWILFFCLVVSASYRVARQDLKRKFTSEFFKSYQNNALLMPHHHNTIQHA